MRVISAHEGRNFLIILCCCSNLISGSIIVNVLGLSPRDKSYIFLRK